MEMEVLLKKLGKGGFERRGVGAKRDEGAENHVATGAANEVETEEFHRRLLCWRRLRMASAAASGEVAVVSMRRSGEAGGS